MKSRSPAVIRNATVRSALRERWPQVHWVVRGGPGSWAAVTWLDGPTKHAVEALLRGVLAPNGDPWGVDLVREVTDELLAVAYWRDRQHGGCPLCLGVDPHTTPATPPGARRTASVCITNALHVDEESLDAADRVAAQAVLAVAGEDRGGYVFRHAKLANTVGMHGHAIEGLLA